MASEYTYRVTSPSSIEIESYKGDDSAIEIPAEIDGYSVTSIGEYAFANRYSLKSATIPEGITSIDRFAFYNCFSLENIRIPEGTKSIGPYAFANCFSLKSITIPGSVTSIGNGAFWDSSSLNIDIPNSVTNIGIGAFHNCNLKRNFQAPAQDQGQGMM